jgi:hypothetical protein
MPALPNALLGSDIALRLMTEAQEPRYARSGDAHIAYQIVGDGPVDLESGHHVVHDCSNIVHLELEGGGSVPRSESPIPRTSNRTSREKLANRFRKRA